MDFDPVLLARLQFAFTISFHIIFPSFTIGLSAYIATLSTMWLVTGNEHYRRIARFWTKIFAVSFAMGVVSGVVLSYQLGTNWSRFSHATGNVIAPLAGYEIITAFFLEASFLGIMLFGGNIVPRWLHVLSSVLVAVGTAISAFWILSANSWMHTPTGHEMRGGIAFPVDWWAIVFNPSFIYRFAHMLNAAYLTAGFVVLAVGARLVLAGRHGEEGRTMMRMAIGLLAILAPLQLFIGDQHGLNTLKYQPIKIAAMEGHWDGSKPGDFHIFAWPDEKAEKNLFAISIPHASWIGPRIDSRRCRRRASSTCSSTACWSSRTEEPSTASRRARPFGRLDDPLPAAWTGRARRPRLRRSDPLLRRDARLHPRGGHLSAGAGQAVGGRDATGR